MTSRGTRNDGTDTDTRGGTNWGTIWAALGVVAAVVFGVIPLIQSNRPSSTPDPPAVSSAVPAPTVTPDDPAPEPSVSVDPRTVPPDPAPRSQVEPPTPGPGLSVSPSSIDLGGEVTIRGSGFEPLTGLHIRWFSTNSISYELGRNVPVEQDGTFGVGGPIENQGFCGPGTIAVFTESGSSFQVPDRSEALATARAVVRC